MNTRSTLKIGLYELNGSWKIALHVARSSAFSPGPPSSETSAPSKRIAPRVDRTSRRIIRPTVLLPLPLSPISETTSPGRDGEADVPHRRQLGAAERAGAVDLVHAVELEHLRPPSRPT